MVSQGCRTWQCPQPGEFGTSLREWQGAPQDYKEALKWYMKSAEQGNAAGQNNLGLMYGHGKGVPQDHKEAVKW